MGNMSYCRHQNTLADLQDVWDKWYHFDKDDATDEGSLPSATHRGHLGDGGWNDQRGQVRMHDYQLSDDDLEAILG